MPATGKALVRVAINGSIVIQLRLGFLLPQSGSSNSGSSFSTPARLPVRSELSMEEAGLVVNERGGGIPDSLNPSPVLALSPTMRVRGHFMRKPQPALAHPNFRHSDSTELSHQVRRMRPESDWLGPKAVHLGSHAFDDGVRVPH